MAISVGKAVKLVKHMKILLKVQNLCFPSHFPKPSSSLVFKGLGLGEACVMVRVQSPVKHQDSLFKLESVG